MMWNTLVLSIFLFSHHGAAALIEGIVVDPNLPGVTIRTTCHSRECRGSWGNGVPNGQTWIQDGTQSNIGCCMFGTGRCVRCLDPKGVETLTKGTTCFVQDNKLMGKIDGKCIANEFFDDMCNNDPILYCNHYDDLKKVLCGGFCTAVHHDACRQHFFRWGAKEIASGARGAPSCRPKQCPSSTIVGLVLATQRGPGLVGGCCREDLNRGAGGDDIFLHANRINGESFRQYGAISDLRLTNGRCEIGYKKLTTCCDGGDLNNNAGGDDIFLCYKEAHGLGSYVVDLRLTTSSTCNNGANGWEKVVGSRNGGELNSNAGGEDIYLCMRKQTCLAGDDDRRKL